MLKELDKDDRLRLMRFVCSFMWADLQVADAERDLVRKLVATLDLDEDEQGQVDEWTTHPPSAEEVDPAEIPDAHRALFLETVKSMIAVDGVVDELEAENLALLEELLS